MINIKNAEECSGCSACASICPLNCITMEADHEGFVYPHADYEKCIGCGKCISICPITNSAPLKSINPQAFAAWNLNEEIRKNSSSGGVFTLLAEKILTDGGAVFGAAFTKDFHAVRHIKAENESELEYLHGSKYLQSSIENSYIEAKKHLDNGKPVLFTGTPCQIAGLHSYLGKEYPLLYTQDLICHGTPSPKVWEQYVNYHESQAGSKTKKVFFRHKECGWKLYSLQLILADGMEHMQTLREDLYMRGFLADLYLRPSCHHCAFKGINRTADITLADFWGINRLMPDMDDDRGTSLIIIHSEKGQRLFNAVKSQLNYKAVSVDRAVAFNSAATQSAKPHPKRKDFFLRLENEAFPKLVSDCLYESPFTRAKNLIRRIARKLMRTLNFRRTP